MNRYYPAQEIRLVKSGQQYFEVCRRLIQDAQRSIHFQTYIFEDDETGKTVADALCNAARRGLQVQVLVDAIGSFPFSKSLEKQFQENGVEFRLFSPLFSSESSFWGRRLHHKVLVTDGTKAVVGGINVADKYNETGTAPAWLDYAIYTESELNGFLEYYCRQFYHKKTRTRLNRWEKQFAREHPMGRGNIRYRVNDWIRGRNEIHNSYLRAIRQSRHSLVIVASYFLPGRQLRSLLAAAAKRGVKIKLIMAGRSDLSSVRLAENFLYDFYQRHQISIYEWQNSVMHGKAMVADEDWATIGSYNLNFLSHYASVELNVDVIDKGFIAAFKSELERVMNSLCVLAEMKVPGKSRPWARQFLRWLAYQLFRSIKSLTMFGSRRNRKK